MYSKKYIHPYICQCVGSYFGQYPGPSGIKDLGPPKSFVLVVWWTGLGSLQLYLANYEPSFVQNTDPTTHTYSYVQIYIYIYIYNVKQIVKEQ